MTPLVWGIIALVIVATTAAPYLLIQVIRRLAEDERKQREARE